MENFWITIYNSRILSVACRDRHHRRIMVGNFGASSREIFPQKSAVGGPGEMSERGTLGFRKTVGARYFVKNADDLRCWFEISKGGETHLVSDGSAARQDALVPARLLATEIGLHFGSWHQCFCLKENTNLENCRQGKMVFNSLFLYQVCNYYAIALTNF